LSILFSNAATAKALAKKILDIIEVIIIVVLKILGKMFPSNRK
jgi:hypothetical protein